MDSGYRDVRYTSRVVDGVCKDDRQSRSVLGVVLSRGIGPAMNNSCQSVSCSTRLPNTSGVVDKCRKRLHAVKRQLRALD
jgi:hypothetical protein